MARSGIGDRVEGFHAVAAAVASGRVERLFFEKSRIPQLRGVLDAAESAGAALEAVADLAGLATTDSPQGVVAHCRPIRAATLEEAVAAAKPPALVVLDHLEDPRNVGAIARSAVGAGLPAMAIARHRSAPLGATAFKAAAGALEHLLLAEVSSVAAALEQLKRLGVWTVGLDAHGRDALFGLPLLAEPVAIVIGSEGRGLGRLVAERVDVIASIPLVGPVESLNASVAAALAVFEIARVREWSTTAGGR